MIKEGIREEKELTLEELFAKLDDILVAMEEKDIPLEEAFVLYEQGLQRIKQCTEKLDMVEKRMLVLKQNGEKELF